MIEKRLAQWYASDTGVDLDIAEREIALTYVLRILADHELLARLAFKGGTAIRKFYLGNQGRFSLDLDFTAMGETDPGDLILDIVGDERCRLKAYTDLCAPYRNRGFGSKPLEDYKNYFQNLIFAKDKFVSSPDMLMVFEMAYE